MCVVIFGENDDENVCELFVFFSLEFFVFARIFFVCEWCWNKIGMEQKNKVYLPCCLFVCLLATHTHTYEKPERKQKYWEFSYEKKEEEEEFVSI